MLKSRFLIIFLTLIIIGACEKDIVIDSDTVRGMISITNPPNHSSVLGVVEIIATVTDFDDIAKVEFYIDNQLPDNGIDSTETYSFLWNTSTLEKNSSHTIFAKAYDINNDTIVSSVINVTIIQGTIQVPTEYPTIQSGINAANDGDTVLVAPGTYNESIDFNGKNIVVGGLYLTTGDTSYISQTIIKGFLGSAVRFTSGEDSLAMLVGLTITYKGGESGLGIYCWNSSPRLFDLVVTGNHHFSNIWWEIGGGIYVGNGSTYLRNVTIRSNSAEYGGGIYFSRSESKLENVIISDNLADFVGGGILCDGSRLTLENVIISNNQSLGSSGIWCNNGSNLYILNTILWNNSIGIADSTDTLTITYSDIQGGESGIETTNNGIVIWGEGNIDLDPMFVSSELENYHLQTGSPCIDAGHPDPQYNDIDGSRNDMGAYGGPNGGW